MERQFIVAPSPHVHGSNSTQRLMLDVVVALLPAWAVSIFFFGWGAVITTLVAVGACILFEYLIQKYLIKGPSTISNLSAVVTGMLLAFNLPTNISPFLVVLGSLVAIGIAKMTFGGLGSNLFNPALVGRVFLLISYPVQMTSWPAPILSRTHYIDAVTGATPLGIVKEALKAGKPVSEIASSIPSYMDLFIGNMGGSLGEVSALALLLGFAYLLIRKVITWHIPLTIFGTIVIFSGILWMANPERYIDPVFHLITGGVMLGAIYMATDYVTSPMTPRGMIYYAVGIGVLTILIRDFGAYPEGVSFAILLMNATTPLINKYVKPKSFGEV
jgi:Na+-translocating ferredoxin:NAD+ oxidoreductase subunit D